MTLRENETGSRFFEAVNAGTARDLLALCVDDHGGGFAGLCSRLGSTGGGEWAERVLIETEVFDDTTGLDVLIAGAGGSAAAARLKHLGKKTAAGSVSPEAEARALLLYLSAAAAALAHQRELISTRDPRVVLDLLIDLERHLPVSLREPVGRAVSALRGILEMD